MTRITGNSVDTALDQGKVTITTGVATLELTSTGDILDADGNLITTVAGSSSTITSASAADAGGTSALSSFTIAHGLGTTPTKFGVTPSTSQGALVSLLGTYVTADSTNVYLNTVSAVTASAEYGFRWWAIL